MNIIKTTEDFFDWAKTFWSLLLILSAFFLLATKTSFNIPLYVMAIIGFYRLTTNNALSRKPEIRFVCILFFSIWLPMLFSLTDAANLPHSLKTTLPYLRFLFAAYFIIDEIKTKDMLNYIVIGILCIIGFWCFDALFQLFVGVDIFGYPIHHGSVAGLFSPKGPLGHILAVFSPVCFELVRRNQSKHRYLWFLLFLFLGIILLGGKRTAWLMTLSSFSIYGIYLLYLYKTAALKLFLIIVPGFVLLMGIFITQYHPLNKKFDRTLGLFSGDRELINKATSMRLPIWETGINVYKVHWINGVGPRGFRHVYAEHADADNLFLSDGFHGATHPHLTLLEIVVETGSLGLFGYLIFWLYLVGFSLHIVRDGHTGRLPWMMCIMISVLPYNTGLAFYGSYWSSVTWWTIIVAACFVFSSQGKKA